jgi:hypothetical protein
MIVTIVGAALLGWFAVAAGVAIAIGRAMRLADEAMQRVTEYATDPDGRPLHPSQMLFVNDILNARVES